MNKKIFIKDLSNIKKALYISFAVIFLINLIFVFILNKSQFYSMILSSSLNFFFFAVTIIFYSMAVKSSAKNRFIYIFFVLFFKLILSGISFYIVSRFGNFNILVYSVSFLIFFTIFFNLEIFLIYKKYLFSKNNS